MLFLTAFIPRSFIEAYTKRMFAARVNSRLTELQPLVSPARHVINARINIKLPRIKSFINIVNPRNRMRYAFIN